MKIDLHRVTVRELTADYEDNQEGGVIGYGGKLDIRPPYQREFIYKDKQRQAVIETLTKDFPLNVMYWAAREDGTFEVIDGQQRTISICQYVEGDFAVKGRYFHNLQVDEKEQILNYELMVYLCSGTDSQKLDWFETINIAGEKLTDQELRNAVYSGSWVADAKRYFSKNNAPAQGLASKYMNGTPNRQDYLETVIKWISPGSIEEYMAVHQHNPNANELWLYFQSVIAWVQATFPKYRREMKGLPWGDLYNQFKGTAWDSAKLEEQITALMMDEDVTNKKGIYSYVLSGQEKHLNIRAFSDNEKREAYERQQSICPICTDSFQIEEMEGDHITPWRDGGKTNAANCQMLCIEDNRRKGAK
ncbi:GmrSD restriction endonuclease domain-containing protein [Glutamicibacter arilaitensis]|uniref:GmrSD restriction endonuclease domain-containing protein n=1 Tax=Glutamicibacter arilaitensis TaxID=256701 RepID=UPI003F934BD6